MGRVPRCVFAALDSLSPWSIGYFLSLIAAWWMRPSSTRAQSGRLCSLLSSDRLRGRAARWRSRTSTFFDGGSATGVGRGRCQRGCTARRVQLRGLPGCPAPQPCSLGSTVCPVLLVLTWIVMVSGAIGFYGQKLIYRLMPLVVDREFGLEQLGPKSEALRQRVEERIAAYPAIAREDVARLAGLLQALRGEDSPLGAAISARLPPHIRAMVGELTADGPDEKQKAEILSAVNRPLSREDLFGRFDGSTAGDGGPLLRSDVAASSMKLRNHRHLIHLLGDQIADRSGRTEATERFFQEMLEERLRTPLGLRVRLIGRRSAAAASRNILLRVKAMAEPNQGEILQNIWDAVELRRQMDVEFWLHGLGRLWLLVHGPAAYVLALFTALHIWGSIRYGGL